MFHKTIKVIGTVVAATYICYGNKNIANYSDPSSHVPPRTSRSLKDRAKNLDDFKEQSSIYISGCNLELNIKRGLEKLLMKQGEPGVAVLLAPKGSGKSVCTDYVVKNMISEKFMSKGALRFTCTTDMLKEPSLYKIMMRHFEEQIVEGYPRLSNSLSESRTKKDCRPVLLIIDQVENIKDHKEFKNFFEDLAKESVNNQEFNVLALCNDSDAATQILTVNGGSKVWAVTSGDNEFFGPRYYLKWSQEHCEKLVKEIEKQLSISLPDLVRERIVLMSCTAGTASICKNLTQDIIKDIENNLEIFKSKNIEEIFKRYESKVEYFEKEWKYFAGFEDRADKIRYRELNFLISRNNNLKKT